MLLLIPGPVTTRSEVRAAMAQDYAPWDNDFRSLYANVRERIRILAGGGAETHTALALQGCGHFAMEACVRTFVPSNERLLVPVAGQYSERLVNLARGAGRDVVALRVSQTEPLAPEVVGAALAADPSIRHVGLVYSETGSGIALDPAAIGRVVHAAGARMILDAISAFGALPLDVSAMPELDAVAFSANKCLEGMPGLCMVVARTDRLETPAATQGGSWALNLGEVFAQYQRSGPGSFRFTPPAQVLASLAVALDLYDAEGGRLPRLARYRENASTLYEGMVGIGLHPYLPKAVQGPIVVNIHAPDDPAWSLPCFVDALKMRGYLISNFYNTPQPSFRVGCIGAITPQDMAGFVAAADASLRELGIHHRGPARGAE
ncbi:MAG: 2-aminoethylphosphonate--pyruvate transaminase [Bryobacteraceae bacterium]|nr:2-aminoethylphosphonate--pyruvate transaminase [Bryobacteraceae bacterium]